MLGILKGPEPEALRRYRETTPGATYAGFADRELVRASLREEQGGLCAYCMRRVRNIRDQEGAIDLTIEHWSAQSTDATRALHWVDLLGVCRGNAKDASEPRVAHTCDKARGNAPLTLHPARDAATIEAWCSYLGDGTLRIRDHDQDVTTLNLNAGPLKRSREVIFALVQQRCGEAALTALRKELARWESRNVDGDRLEYAGVAIYLLRRLIRAREGRGRRTRGLPR